MERLRSPSKLGTRRNRAAREEAIRFRKLPLSLSHPHLLDHGMSMHASLGLLHRLVHFVRVEQATKASHGR